MIFDYITLRTPRSLCLRSEITIAALAAASPPCTAIRHNLRGVRKFLEVKSKRAGFKPAPTNPDSFFVSFAFFAANIPFRIFGCGCAALGSLRLVLLNLDLRHHRRVVGRPFLGAHLAVDRTARAASCQLRRQKNMIDAQAKISLEAVHPIIPPTI